MEINTAGNIVTIDGNIKSVADFSKIKSSMDGVVAIHKTITLNKPNQIVE